MIKHVRASHYLRRVVMPEIKCKMQQYGSRIPTPKFMKLRGRPIDYVGMDEG